MLMPPVERRIPCHPIGIMERRSAEPTPSVVNKPVAILKLYYIPNVDHKVSEIRLVKVRPKLPRINSQFLGVPIPVQFLPVFASTTSHKSIDFKLGLHKTEKIRPKSFKYRLSVLNDNFYFQKELLGRFVRLMNSYRLIARY